MVLQDTFVQNVVSHIQVHEGQNIKKKLCGMSMSTVNKQENNEAPRSKAIPSLTPFVSAWYL